MSLPRVKIGALAGMALLPVVSLVGCKDSESGPLTAPGGATVMGTVVNGDDPASPPIAGVSVRAVRTGQFTQTDGAGNFTVSGVPAGDQLFMFSKGSDVNAQGTISVATGSSAEVVATIMRHTTVVIAPRGSGRPGLPAQTPTITLTPVPGTPTVTATKVEEIEGIVTANDGSTLAILDQRLGTVIVNVTGSTIIRKGQTPMTAAEIAIGWRVHVKGLLTSAGTYSALEIIVQDTNPQTTGTPTAVVTTTPTATRTNTPTAGTPTVTATPTAGTPTVTPTVTATPTMAPTT